jgi:hypothetical protein
MLEPHAVGKIYSRILKNPGRRVIWVSSAVLQGGPETLSASTYSTRCTSYTPIKVVVPAYQEASK